MKKAITTFLSSFFLVLLLFPMVEKEIHAFEHKDDVHCMSSEKHFHAMEHHCSICDYTATHSTCCTNSKITFILSAKDFFFQPFLEKNKYSDFQFLLRSRAPPIA
jgi:hypothetical protein